MAEDPVPELQNSKEDDTSIEIVPLGVKILEVILAVFAIGLMVDPFNSFQRIHNKPQTYLNDVAIVYVTVAGYILINMVIIIGYLMGDRLPKKTALLFSALGAFLFIVAGSVIVNDWRKLRGSYFQVSNNAIFPSKQYMDMMISASVFTFVDAAVFILDVFVIYQYS